jgi:hypothetical protein
MDEVMVPVALISDLSDPLFAQNPVTWISQNQIAGSAGFQGNIVFQNLTPGITCIVDRVLLTNNAAVGELLFAFLDRAEVLVPVVGQTFSQAILNAPIGKIGGTQPISTVISQRNDRNQPAASSTVATVFLAVGTPLLLPLGVVLFPGDSLWISCGVGVAQTFLATSYGREFRSI